MIFKVPSSTYHSVIPWSSLVFFSCCKHEDSTLNLHLQISPTSSLLFISSPLSQVCIPNIHLPFSWPCHCPPNPFSCYPTHVSLIYKISEAGMERFFYSNFLSHLINLGEKKKRKIKWEKNKIKQDSWEAQFGKHQSQHPEILPFADKYESGQWICSRNSKNALLLCSFSIPSSGFPELRSVGTQELLTGSPAFGCQDKIQPTLNAYEERKIRKPI